MRYGPRPTLLRLKIPKKHRQKPGWLSSIISYNVESGKVEMAQNNILKEFDTLPPEAQKQVIDFIAFLQMRYEPKKDKKI
ncbi:MAG TPA: DUF2281 domain-containing protein, partial [Gammaproteobacteria bacterium]|nr:DUF2281 domain-containing protein [Gammaproteobacteria bacterium]